MTFLQWTATVGGLLLFMALASAYLKRLPLTTSAIYLGFGLLLGPLGTGVLTIDLAASAPWFERITETAVIVSLFIGGLKLRLPLHHAAWRPAYRMAGPLMLVCIAGVAATAWFLGVPLAAALLLGAVLAPTDPVLASTVSVNDAADRDRMRYGLSGEAGLNDGTAFPFVVFALLWMEHNGAGAWIGTWALHRIVWAVPAGLLLGYLLGRGVGRLAIRLASRHGYAGTPNDFLALSLIALSYVGAEAIGGWGFLSVFAAGVGLRFAERRAVHDSPHPDQPVEDTARDERGTPHPPAEDLVGPNVDEDSLKEPAVAAGVLVSDVLSFGTTAERLLEALVVIVTGAALATHWDSRGVFIAAILFVVIRPLATRLILTGTETTVVQRWLMGWFGIRGIGSFYYLMYALTHGAESGSEVVPLAVTVVAMSILVHGITAQPVLDHYETQLSRTGEQSGNER